MEIKKTAARIAVCGVIAGLSCLASADGAFRFAIVFIGDLAVLFMITEAFSLARNYFKPRVLGCVEISVKIAFAALCALSGGVLLHAAALIVDCVLSEVFGEFNEAN